MNTKRSNYIDILKGFGILCVVAGHTAMLPQPLHQWVESFHMALFFVAAGVLIGQQKSYQKDSGAILKGRSRSILIPYFWFGLIAMLWDTCGIYLDPIQYTKAGLIKKIWDSCTFYGVSVLWFLPAFFVAVTGYQILRKFVPLWLSTVIAAVLCAIIFWCDSIPDFIEGLDCSPLLFFLQLAFVFWRGAVGMLFCAIGEVADYWITKLSGHKLFKLLIGIILISLGSLFAMENEIVSFRYLITGNRLFFVLAGACIPVGLLFLFEWIGELPPMAYLGRSSMIIFLTHLDLRVMNIAIKCSDKIFAITSNNFAKYLVLGLVLLVLELILIQICERYLWFLFGKKRPLKKIKGGEPK